MMKSPLRALFTAIYAASFVTLIVVNAKIFRDDGNYLRSRTGDVSEKYTTLITPQDWTFFIWGVIYIWLVAQLGYILSTFCRWSDAPATVGGVRDVPVYLITPAVQPFFLGTMSATYLFLAAWLWIFVGRKNLAGSAAVLWVVTFLVFVAAIYNYVTLYETGPRLNMQKRSEIWLNRMLIQNGLELLGGWLLVMSVVNTVMALQYGAYPGGSGTDPKATGTVALSLLLFAYLFWYPLEITVFDKYCRYGVMQYLVAAVAMYGIYDRRDTIEYKPLERLALAFAIIASIQFVLKVILTTYRETRKPLFSEKAPPVPTRFQPPAALR